MYFESHAHYADEAFEQDRDALLLSLQEAQVSYVVNVGADMNSSCAGIYLAERYDFIYAAVGIHPHEVTHMEEEDIERLKKLVIHPKVVAIGEIGLDYYYDHAPREKQQYWFMRQMELAKEVQLPVIIHSRDAAAETLDLIVKSGIQKESGVIHCYSGSAQMAKQYVDMGFYIGIGGVVTFANARKTVEVVEAIPLESILLETDCPYLSPAPNRGKRNDSKNLIHISEKIGQIKGISKEEVACITRENAKKMFRL